MERKIIIPLKEIPSSIKSKIHRGLCVIEPDVFFVRDLENWTIYTGPSYYSKLVTFYNENSEEMKNILNYWALSYEKYVKNNKIIFKILDEEEYF